MKTRIPAIALALAASLLIPSRLAFAWGCIGHETVAEIAKSQLSETALKRVTSLLRNHLPSDTPACSQTGLDWIESASTWADDVRNARPKTRDWHFIDIPRGSTDVASSCGDAGCAISAIDDAMETLRSHKKAALRAEALRFLIHFVGDIHQPLHATTNDDRGGNCVPVKFFTDNPTLKTDQNSDPNLHSVWDKSLIEHGLKIPKQGGQARTDAMNALAANLVTEFGPQFPVWQSGTPAEWALESHEIAESVAYGKLPTPVPVAASFSLEKCSEHNTGKALFALHEEIDQTYEDAAIPLIKEQLAKGGARLAMLLNSIWP